MSSIRRWLSAGQGIDLKGFDSPMQENPAEDTASSSEGKLQWAQKAAKRRRSSAVNQSGRQGGGGPVKPTRKLLDKKASQPPSTAKLTPKARKSSAAGKRDVAKRARDTKTQVAGN
jgi:hypothetical protein